MVYKFNVRQLLRRDRDRLAKEREAKQKERSMREDRIRDLRERQTKLEYRIKELNALSKTIEDLRKVRDKMSNQNIVF
jgi:DNA repair exonuclease SbcCD ATPase subunit